MPAHVRPSTTTHPLSPPPPPQHTHIHNTATRSSRPSPPSTTAAPPRSASGAVCCRFVAFYLKNAHRPGMCFPINPSTKSIPPHPTQSTIPKHHTPHQTNHQPPNPDTPLIPPFFFFLLAPLQNPKPNSWAVQRGYAAIPKSTKAERLAENIGVFDFVLSEEEMGQILALDRCVCFVFLGGHGRVCWCVYVCT